MSSPIYPKQPGAPFFIAQLFNGMLYPPPSNSHHQDYYIFSGESQPKPSFATGILGGR